MNQKIRSSIAICATVMLIPFASVLAGQADDVRTMMTQTAPVVVHDNEKVGLSLEEQVRLSSKEFIKIYELFRGGRKISQP